MLHPRADRRVAGAAELGGSVLAAMANRASVLEDGMGRSRADEQIEFRMRAPRVERVVGRILNPFELRDPLLGLLPLFLRNLIRVELLLQLLRQSRRLRLRLPSRHVDGAMAGLAAVDARDVHVVHVDRQIVQNHLIDLDHRVDEVEHGLAENPVRAERLHVDGAELLAQQIHRGGQLFFLVLGVLDLLQPLINVRLRCVPFARRFLQGKLQLGEVLRLPLVLRLLLRRIGAMLHDRSLGDVALGVEVRLGEAIVLIGAIVIALDRVERLLRGKILIAMAGQLDGCSFAPARLDRRAAACSPTFARG